VSVAIRESGAHLRFEVSDDGRGFNVADADRGVGLQNMRDRVGALDGQLSIVSRTGRGTMVYGSLPLSAYAARSAA
jgi:two-component system NarL family sensor kinase